VALEGLRAERSSWGEQQALFSPTVEGMGERCELPKPPFVDFPHDILSSEA
jgi:hypothetical protein